MLLHPIRARRARARENYTMSNFTSFTSMIVSALLFTYHDTRLIHNIWHFRQRIRAQFELRLCMLKKWNVRRTHPTSAKSKQTRKRQRAAPATTGATAKAKATVATMAQ
jgi:hypothetical protein